MQWHHVNFSPKDPCCHGNQPFLFKNKIGCRLTRASNAETQLLCYIAWQWDRYLVPQNVFLVMSKILEESLMQKCFLVFSEISRGEKTNEITLNRENREEVLTSEALRQFERQQAPRPGCGSKRWLPRGSSLHWTQRSSLSLLYRVSSLVDMLRQRTLPTTTVHSIPTTTSLYCSIVYQWKYLKRGQYLHAVYWMQYF